MLADYGKLHVSSTDYTVLRPDGVDAATRGWRTALVEGRALRVRGSGHGLSGATLPRKGETLLCTRGLDHYRIEAPGLITVGGGAILWDVRDFVAVRGWRLPVYNGGWAGPTVGGFASAGGLGLRVPVGEHGKPTAPQALDPVSLSERHGGFWAQAVKLTIIDGRGRVHDILPGDEDFPWMFASMGQFGLILEATLRLVPQPGVDDALPVGSAGRIPVSNPLDPNESDAAAPAQGVDWTYWFTAFAPVDEEDAVWQAIGDWSRAHRDALRPTGGWIGPLQDDHPIGFRYLVRRKAPTPPLLYPRDEDFLTLGVMAVCAGVGTDAGDAALAEAEQDFVARIVARGWALYCQAENLTRSVDFRSYWGEERWQRFCALKARFDPDGRINVGEVHGEGGPSPMRAARMRRIRAAFRRAVGIGDPGVNRVQGASRHGRGSPGMKHVDVAVIGGGPAGATLATLCAQNGLEVALYERERAPRYRVGESLLPATPRQIVPLLGATDEMAQADFVVKPGGTFCWGDRPGDPWTLKFAGYTALNVDRQRFDAILLANARAKGVAVHEGEAVRSVGEGDAEQGRVVEVETLDSGTRYRVQARYVADASGQRRLNLPELRARTWSRFFRQVAVWGYWDGAGRLDPPIDGTVLFETLETAHGPAWVWFIPLSDTLTSVGVVAPRGCARALGKNRRPMLSAWLAQCPRTAALLAEARPSSAPPYHEVRLCADYSYASDAFWAPGVVQVGDAACFVDPMLASGVHMATYGALLAARSIEAVLRGRAPEPLAMDEYESRARQEYALFYAGVSGIYDMTRSRDQYIQPLRKLLRNSNGVLVERDQLDGAPGGLNVERAAPPSLDPARDAARNRRTMRTFNRDQLLYDGPPRIVPVAELPAIRNTLSVSPDGRGWRLPGDRGSGRVMGQRRGDSSSRSAIHG